MPLLPELGGFEVTPSYKDVAPTALPIAASRKAECVTNLHVPGQIE